jgi:hypothetical protein
MEKRPRGRPEIADEDRKATIVACRVDADERAEFVRAAEYANLRLSDWMRARLTAAARREAKRNGHK